MQCEARSSLPHSTRALYPPVTFASTVLTRAPYDSQWGLRIMPGAVDPFADKEFDVARARILVADDHEEVRNTIVRLLKRRFEVVAALGDGPTFLEAVARLKPDLCVLDISMPNMSG